MSTASASLEGGESGDSVSSFGTTVREEAPRGQRKDRAGRWSRDVLHGQVPGAPTPQPELFQLYEEEPGGSRPPCLDEPRGPQDKDQQRTMEQAADFAPIVQILDAPVAQMVEQLPNLSQFFDTLMPDPEQVVEVPKILLDDFPTRTAVRGTQLAEQLVEVLTIVSSSWLQLCMEQNVDFPVPGHEGRYAGLQG